MDCLFLGIDLAAEQGEAPECPAPEFPLLPPGTPLPPLSVSPISPPGIAAEEDSIMSKAKLLEMLRERERDRQARRRRKGDKICVFCRNNGESEAVYTTHQLKNAQGQITCPVLYIYTCPICNASGEKAHTIKYCPLNTGDKTTAKKGSHPAKTARNAAGRRR